MSFSDGLYEKDDPLWYMTTPLPEYHRWAVTKYMGWTINMKFRTLTLS